jgi:hypothetical protein
MNEDIDESTLTVGRLLFWCVVGTVMWIGILLGCVKLIEVVS